jgi:Virulence factor
VAEFQVTRWRDLPSLVVAREGGDETKGLLAPRFQEAIDEAAMRLGDTSTENYLAGWTRTEWTRAQGSPAEVCGRVVAELEEQWSAERLTEYLAELGDRA